MPTTEDVRSRCSLAFPPSVTQASVCFFPARSESKARPTRRCCSKQGTQKDASRGEKPTRRCCIKQGTQKDASGGEKPQAAGTDRRLAAGAACVFNDEVQSEAVAHTSVAAESTTARNAL